MKCRWSICTLFYVVACASVVQETLPSAASILDRYVEITGGKAAWLAIRTGVRKATYELLSAGVEMAMTVWRAVPGRSYLLMEAPGLGRVEEGTDGETVWGRSTIEGPMGEITTESYPTGYRRVNDVLISFKVSAKVLGNTTTLAIEILRRRPRAAEGDGRPAEGPGPLPPPAHHRRARP